MRNKLYHSILISLEWRLIAFLITNGFLWFTTGDFWTATSMALMLQVILFVIYIFWYFWRHELGMPLIPRLSLQRSKAAARADQHIF